MYIFVYLILLIISFIEVRYNRSFPILPALIFLILISAIRDHVGVDFSSYSKMFNNLQSVDDYPQVEIGFKYYIYYLKEIGANSVLFFSIISTVSLVLFYTVVKNMQYRYFALFLFYCTSLIVVIFSGMRQGLVMLLFLISLKYIYERRLLLVMSISFLAISIHTTGIFILFSYFLPIKLKLNKTVLVTLIVFLCCLYFSNINTTIINIMPNYVQSKFSDYQTSFADEINFIRVLQRVLLLIPFLYFYNEIKRYEYLLSLFYLYLFGFILYILFSDNLAFATRLNQFYRIIEVLIFPMLLSVISKKYDKMIVYSIVTVWATLIFFMLLGIDGNYPYKTYFNMDFF